VENEAGLLEETEEVDIISLLTLEVEDDDDMEDEEVDTEVPDTIEGLREALEREREIKSKRNKALKKSKQATHRIQEENQALLNRLDQIDQRINSAQPNNDAEADAKEIQEWQDRVADDSTQALAYTDWKQSKFEEKVALYLGTQMNELRGMIGGLQSATNPEVVKYRSQIDALRRKEEFAQLDDNILLTIAKGLSGAKVKTPRGTVGGQRPGATAPPAYRLSDEDRAKMGF